MKSLFVKTLSSLALFLALVNISFAATSVTTEYMIKTQSGGRLQWNGFEGESCGCPFSGDDCYIKVTKTTTPDSKVQKLDNGSYRLDTKVEGLTAFIENGGRSFENTVSVSDYIFPDASTVTLNGVAEFPELEGKVIQIGGIKLDANGRFYIIFK